jgi:hypothetical protein
MPPSLPPNIAAKYRPSTSNEVRAESFGVLKTAKLHAESDWQKQRGSFDDQRIFGPRRRYECACGKYQGSEHGGIICDLCGVKITTPDVRRVRCAHINLDVEIPHPLGTEQDRLHSIPVLPVSFVEAERGGELLFAYDVIIRARDGRAVAEGFTRLCEILCPVLVTAHCWDLGDRLLIAHGMALKDPAAEPADYFDVPEHS